MNECWWVAVLQRRCWFRPCRRCTTESCTTATYLPALPGLRRAASLVLRLLVGQPLVLQLGVPWVGRQHDASALRPGPRMLPTRLGRLRERLSCKLVHTPAGVAIIGASAVCSTELTIRCGDWASLQQAASEVRMRGFGGAWPCSELRFGMFFFYSLFSDPIQRPLYSLHGRHWQRPWQPLRPLDDPSPQLARIWTHVVGWRLQAAVGGQQHKATARQQHLRMTTPAYKAAIKQSASCTPLPAPRASRRGAAPGCQA